jgi:hypothetical protein
MHVGAGAPEHAPCCWSLSYGHHRDRTPTHGYEATREAAIAAFAKSWRRVCCRSRPSLQRSGLPAMLGQQALNQPR